MDRTERNIKLSSCTATLEHGGHWRQRNVSLVVHSVEQVLCYIHKFKETPAAVQPAVAYLCKTISCNTVQTLLMMSENMARNMQSSQGIINYPTQLHLVGHFRILYCIYLTLRRLMSYIYIYMEHPFLMFLDHTQRRSTVGRTPLDE